MRRISAWIAAALWVGVIFFSSTSLALRWADAAFQAISNEFFRSLKKNVSSFDLVHFLADKGFHVSLFCVLAVLLWLALRGSGKRAWIVLAAGALIGTCSELLQRLFPDRDPAIRDVLINAGGTALGIVLCSLSSRLVARQRSVVQPETRVISSSPK